LWWVHPLVPDEIPVSRQFRRQWWGHNNGPLLGAIAEVLLIAAHGILQRNSCNGIQNPTRNVVGIRRLYVKPSCVIAIVIVWIPYRRGYLITTVVGNEWIKQQFLSRDDCTLDSWAGFIALWRPSWASWCVIIVSYSTLHTICYYPCSCTIPT
jgi:hypothetical protein